MKKKKSSSFKCAWAAFVYDDLQIDRLGRGIRAADEYRAARANEFEREGNKYKEVIGGREKKRKKKRRVRDCKQS